MTTNSGLSDKDFANALREFRAAVGTDWVFTKDEHLNSYRDLYSPLYGTDKEALPAAAVAPANVEEVQKVVKIANHYLIPFWINSCGRNFGFGGPAGVVNRTINLDLKRMSRILEVNEEHAYAVVEPGVSFFDLYRYIQEKGIKLWMDVPGPGWGSVIGNTIERGMGYTNYCDRALVGICGMEVVLPGGEVMRTGMGAIPDTELWHQYPESLGPSIGGMFTQTSLGVVTKMGIWLQPEQPVALVCEILGTEYDSLVPMIDIMRHPRQAGIITNNATVYPYPFKDYTGNNILEKSNADPKYVEGWANAVAFYGLPKQVDAQWEYVQDLYSSELPGVKFESTRYTSPIRVEDIKPGDPRMLPHTPRLGIPGMMPAYHEAYFSFVVPFRGEAAMTFTKTYDRIAREFNRRFAGHLFHALTPHALITPPGGTVKVGEPEYNRETVELMRRWIEAITELGWGPDRVHPAFMDEAMSAYSFNNDVLRRFNETIKDVLDPNGILAPGKNGIWPKRMRGSVS